MSYSDFLDTLISPIRLFVSALSQVADSLIHNYIIITLLGLTLFISLVWLIYYTFHDFINSKIDKIEDKIDRYNKYELYKEVQREYLDKHRVDEFMYLYDLTILKQQVMNGIYRNNPGVLLDNITQFNKLRAQALKNIKKEYENDNNPNNDDDIDYLIPTLPIQKASLDELKQANQKSWLRDYSQQLEGEIISNVDRIMYNNRDLLSKIDLSYDKKNNVFFDTKTGEVVNLLDKLNKYKEDFYLYTKNGEVLSLSKDDFIKIVKDVNTPSYVLQDFLDNGTDEMKKIMLDIFRTPKTSLNSDNLKIVNDKVVDMTTGEVFLNEVGPIPSGKEDLNKMTLQDFINVRKFNEEHFIMPTENKDRRYGDYYGEERLDSELFSSK